MGRTGSRIPVGGLTWEDVKSKLETETDYKIKPYDDDLNLVIDLAAIPDVLTGKDADSVDGHDAGTEADQVLVLDANGLVPIGNIPSRLLKPIAHIEVTSAVSSVDITGLDGDTDEAYLILIVGYLTGDGSNDYHTLLQINDDTTNYIQASYFRHENSGGSTNSNVDTTPTSGISLGRNAWQSSGDIATIAFLRAKSGRHRSCTVLHFFRRGGYDNYCHGAVTGGTWKNSDANITKLTINFQGNSFEGIITIYAVRL